MYKYILSVLFLSLSVLSQQVPYVLSSPIGYAGNVTGGSGGSVEVVSTAAALKTALGKSGKLIILVKGTLTFTSQMTGVVTDKTIIGLPNAKLVSDEQTAGSSGIWQINDGSKNVIIRNLKFEGPGAYDVDGKDLLFVRGTNIWVDHCEFKDGVDGNFDISNKGDNITVTWNVFGYDKPPKAGGSGGADDHRFSNLISGSDGTYPDDGNYNVTLAYNRWTNGARERMPRARNSTLHLLNNYVNTNVSGSKAIGLSAGEKGTSVYVENCDFAKVGRVLDVSYGGSPKVTIVGSNKDNGDTNGGASKPSYPYTALPWESVEAAITGTCGAGAKLQVNESTGAVSCGNEFPSSSGLSWKFDFGNRAVENGYTGVSATEAYSASKGYGFNTPANMANVNAAGNGALNDAVQFKTIDENNVFNVDLDNGLYQVSIWLGNTGRTSIKAEGMYQVMNMTGNNAYYTLQLPVTDGQLNIQATEGKAGNVFTMSALEITRISENPAMKKTIWLCGNSTVCDYYPLESSAQAGWGQMLKGFIDSGEYEIRNIATSGQFAKGFLESGQFTTIEHYGKAGDIYVISIGINDGNYSNRTEYYNVVTDMVIRAKAKGMTVVLVKQQGRASDVSKKPLLTGRWFGGELDKIGSEQNVPVVDLFNMWQTYAVSIGQEQTLEHYMPGDDLHPNRKGATKLAEFMASVLPLSSGSKSSGSSFGEQSSSSNEGGTPIIHVPFSICNSETLQYYNLKGEPLGRAKPKRAGIYIVKQGYLVKKIVVR